MVKVLTAGWLGADLNWAADFTPTPWAEIEYVSPTPVSMPGLVKVAAVPVSIAVLSNTKNWLPRRSVPDPLKTLSPMR